MNPIENCWSHIKRKLKDKDISSVPKLIAKIKMLWTCNLSRQFFKNLSDSMPRRIQLVQAAKGEATRY